MAFDAIIVGAGIIGASIAWRLSQSGLRVLLLDAARMGGEASSAGAGMRAPGGEIEQPSPWIDLAIASLRSYPAFIAELEEETGCQIDFNAWERWSQPPPPGNGRPSKNAPAASPRSAFPPALDTTFANTCLWPVRMSLAPCSTRRKRRSTRAT